MDTGAVGIPRGFVTGIGMVLVLMPFLCLPGRRSGTAVGDPSQ
jgi:hypothetical protein